MNLRDIVNRKPDPVPWSEGDKIPWDEPEFSRRMLKEHLSQAHDAASRRFEIIDGQVNWIHHQLLREKPSNVLDLGCGPGFYTSRLARLGHICTGIDFSPASIEYAVKMDASDKTGCTYIQHDLRSVDYREGFDFVMLLYGEFNTFRKPDANDILTKALGALNPHGQLLLELESYNCLHDYGNQPPSWSSSQSGLFSEKPHLTLTENFWDEELKASTQRIYNIDAASGEVIVCADNHQTYSDEEIQTLSLDCGFSRAVTYSAWPVKELSDLDRYLLLVAEK
jgi:SAM-dependent methyltransferase